MDIKGAIGDLAVGIGSIAVIPLFREMFKDIAECIKRRGLAGTFLKGIKIVTAMAAIPAIGGCVPFWLAYKLCTDAGTFDYSSSDPARQRRNNMRFRVGTICCAIMNLVVDYAVYSHRVHHHLPSVQAKAILFDIGRGNYLIAIFACMIAIGFVGYAMASSRNN